MYAGVPAAGPVAPCPAAIPEVDELRGAVRGDQHVLGLVVPVDDPDAWAAASPSSEPLRTVRRGLRADGPVLAQQGAQGDAVDQLHDDGGAVRALHVLVQPHDVRRLQCAQQAGLAAKCAGSSGSVRRLSLRCLTATGTPVPWWTARTTRPLAPEPSSRTRCSRAPSTCACCLPTPLRGCPPEGHVPATRGSRPAGGRPPRAGRGEGLRCVPGPGVRCARSPGAGARC